MKYVGHIVPVIDISLLFKWRKLLNDDLHSLYFTLNIVRLIKSGRMR
jgi:hypothetical protein